jgi:hypothetical protein
MWQRHGILVLVLCRLLCLAYSRENIFPDSSGPGTVRSVEGQGRRWRNGEYSTWW